MLRFVHFLSLWCLVFASEAEALSCKDENNREVDWYILYKQHGSQKYIYISSKGEEKTSKLISANNGVLANSLSPMLQRTLPQNIGFLSYSDQPPDGQTVLALYGHTKGVVLGDSGTKTALWITHSTPKFPNRRDLNHFWPGDDVRMEKAQTFMCVSLKLDQLKDIGLHLQRIRAFAFDSHIPAGFPKEMRDAANNKGPEPHVLKLKVGNKELQVVAKGSGLTVEDGDLYLQLARQLQSDIDAKIWCQPRGNDGSYCKDKFKVINVEEVQLDGQRSSWSSDHSKWAVATDNNRPWTCIADVNRAQSQYERPGGALCIHDETVNTLFKGFVVKEREPCRKRPRPCDSSDDVDVLSDNLGKIDL